jgi:hypothetical protein
MHISLVIDEAGDASLDGYFEGKGQVKELCKRLQKKLATTCHVVVCGTGLTGMEFSSKFRMIPWTRADLAQVLNSFQLFPQREVDDAIAAIFQQPTLRALSTNARSARHLVATISDFRAWLHSVCWVELMSDFAPALVTDTVTNYIGQNGLRNLSDSNRRRVAASLFYVIEKARTEPLAKGPLLTGLSFYLLPIARALLDLNVERLCGEEKPAEGIDHQSVLVTPAIVVVLCFMLGANARVLTTSGCFARVATSSCFEISRFSNRLASSALDFETRG